MDYPKFVKQWKHAHNIRPHNRRMPTAWEYMHNILTRAMLCVDYEEFDISTYKGIYLLNKDIFPVNDHTNSSYTGDILTDYINVRKLAEEHPTIEVVFHSSSVDHFLVDGPPNTAFGVYINNLQD